MTVVEDFDNPFFFRGKLNDGFGNIISGVIGDEFREAISDQGACFVECVR